jgi:hypothetical protein
MKRRMTLLGLAAGLLLAACGGDPMKASLDALAAKDPGKAEALLADLVQKQPALRGAHLQLFVVAQYLASQGDPSRQKLMQDLTVAQYDWLVASYGLAADYRDMDASLKANAQAAVDLAVARKPLYGD